LLQIGGFFLLLPVILQVSQSLFDHIKPEFVPQHVAIIMDGNGRWAKQQGKDRVFGHFQGVESVRNSVKAAIKTKVKFLTLYAFSTENWNRPKEEVDALMELLVNTILKEVPSLNEQGIRLRFIGDRATLPESCVAAMVEAENLTIQNNTLQLILALSYSARWEITQAVKRMLDDNVKSDEVSDELFSKYLDTKDIPDPELLIRTSGELRISNFLLWQIAYAELFFTQAFWPDFNEELFFEAILSYQSRERRFGKTSDQMKPTA
jgi:undecaprenyl diphosphate synthase